MFARPSGWHRRLPVAGTESSENLNGQTELSRGALARKWLAQPHLQLALGSSDEAFMLLKEDSEPRVVVLPEVVRDHDRPGHAIAEQIGGQQGPGVSGVPDRLRWCFA
jgi:hypothetical protein